MKRKPKRNRQKDLGSKRRQVSVTFDLPIRDKLEAHAQEEGRTVSYMVNSIVTLYYEDLNAPPLPE